MIFKYNKLGVGFYKLLVLCCLTAFASLTSKGQNIGIGASGLYNFQTEGWGVGARLSINPNNRLSFVPQFSYYLPSNKVNEYYAGLSIEYKLYLAKKFHLYALMHGAYNSWLNYESSPMEDAQANNWNLEFGGGLTTNGCWRPFIEYRYNMNFKETHLQVGIMYILGCGSRSSHGICPAYH